MTHFATSCRIGALLLLCACLRVCRKMCAKKNEKKNEKSPSGDFNFFSLPFFFLLFLPPFPFLRYWAGFYWLGGLGRYPSQFHPLGFGKKGLRVGCFFVSPPVGVPGVRRQFVPVRPPPPAAELHRRFEEGRKHRGAAAKDVQPVSIS